MTDWRDLSDDELTARLIRRGVDPMEATALVEGRESESAIAWVNFYLGATS